MTDNDSRSYIFGVSSPLTLPGRTVAAKTGTTNNWHDGWTMGFTPSLAAGVWSGNNDGTLLKKGADGVLVAAPIWNEFMKRALESTPAENFTVPSGIQKITVDEVSGKLPTDATPNTKEETFTSYNAPTDYDNVHIRVAMDSLTGLPATNLTPPNQITYKLYSVLHSERRDNPSWETPVVEWALAHGYSYPPSDTISPNPTSGGQNISITILEPQEGKIISSSQFQVTVGVNSSLAVSRIDLSIDGEFYQSINSQPFVFNVNKNLQDGNHILAIHAVDTNGSFADTSTTIISEATTPLSLTQPLNQSLVQFPLNIIAESENLYTTVNFYYVNNKGQSKLIGPAENVDHIGKYNYSINWKTSPPSGTYKIYAQTNSGILTHKVSITIP